MLKKYWKIIIPGIVLVLTGAITTPIVLMESKKTNNKNEKNQNDILGENLTLPNGEEDIAENEDTTGLEDAENKKETPTSTPDKSAPTTTPSKVKVDVVQNSNKDLSTTSNIASAKENKIPKWAENNTMIRGYYDDDYPDYEIDFLERDKAKSKWLNQEKTDYEVWYDGYKYVVKKAEKPFSIQRIKEILKNYIIGYMTSENFENNFDNVWMLQDHNIDFSKRDKAKSKWLNKEKTKYQVVVSYSGSKHKYVFEVSEKDSINKIKELLK